MGPPKRYRHAAEKVRKLSLRQAVKGTKWRQARGVVFRQIDSWFVVGHDRPVSANLDDGRTIEIMAKPMTLDPMLWRTMGLSENESQPLGFRYWARLSAAHR